MKLYVMRHGHSPTVQEAGVKSDVDRPLSDKGHADARSQAKRLLDKGARPGLILHSPLRRAVETAGEAASVLGVEARAFEPLSNELGPDALAAQLAPVLAERGELLIVGHQPQVGELAAWLSAQAVDFKPAAVAAFELQDAPAPRKAALLWSAPPGSVTA